MADLTTMAQIADLIAKRDALSAQLGAMNSSRNDWFAQTQKTCSGIGQKKKDCEADLLFKKGKVATYDAQIKATNDSIANYNVQIAGLQKALENESIANVKLAEKGVSGKALELEAVGKAAADKVAAENVSTAQADAIRQMSEVQAESAKKDAKAKQDRNMLFIGIGVVALLLILFFVIKKIKSKSKSKK